MRYKETEEVNDCDREGGIEERDVVKSKEILAIIVIKVTPSILTIEDTLLYFKEYSAWVLSSL